MRRGYYGSSAMAAHEQAVDEPELKRPVAVGSLAMIAALAVVALIATLWIASVPASADPVEARAEPNDALTIMSFNIASFHACNSGACLYDDPDYMLGVVAELIIENGVDVVGLQEVDKATNHHLGVDMMAELQAKLTAAGYPMYGWFEGRSVTPPAITQGEFGIAMLSRVPAISYSSQLYSSSIHASSAPVQQAVFDVDGTTVRVINHHAYVTGSCDTIDPGIVDVVQVAELLDEFTVLIGDFNDPLTSPCMSTLLTTHESVCIESGDPTCAIGVDQVHHPNHPWNVDHVLYRFGSDTAASFLDGWVDQTVNENASTFPGDFWVSDHYPVIGRFALNTPSSGDVNCDGGITLADALLIARYAAQLTSGASRCPEGGPAVTLNTDEADITGDSAINDGDVLAVLECLVRDCGRSAFPVGPR